MILLVEDNPDLRNAMTEMLNDFGLPTACLKDGRNLLKKIRQHQPNIVIMDISLPGKNGDVLAQEIRKQFPPLKPGIILISSRADVDQIAQQIGVEASLEKPIDMHQLYQTIQNLD